MEAQFNGDSSTSYSTTDTCFTLYLLINRIRKTNILCIHWGYNINKELQQFHLSFMKIILVIKID